MIHVRPVRSNFLDVLGIPILAGEGFRPEHNRDTTWHYVVNDLLARKGVGIGDRLDDGVVVGICPDIHFRPLQYPVVPFAFVTLSDDMDTFYVRLAAGANPDAVCDHIRRTVERLDSDCDPIEIRFMDEGIDAQYARERRIATVVGLFTVLAVVIALMGVFGIVLFETQHRRREVAIRKVMGATTAEPHRSDTGPSTAGSGRLPIVHRCTGGSSSRPSPWCWPSQSLRSPSARGARQAKTPPTA